jgi:hypothetical protein
MRWTPWGVGRYENVKTWLMRNLRTNELRYVDCTTRLELLAAYPLWTTCHAVEYWQ